jgi:hypothetical protein
MTNAIKLLLQMQSGFLQFYNDFTLHLKFERVINKCRAKCYIY